MDRVIKKKRWTTKKIILAGVIVGAVLFALYGFLFADNRSKVKTEREKITISTVKEGEFQEYIPRSGTVQPIRSIYMDAIEGGVVKQLVRESGDMVDKGDTIMILTNSNLQLDVMNRETMLYEQLNNQRNIRLNLDQNTLRLKQDLAEIDYQIKLLEPQYERFKELYEKKLVSKREFEEVKEPYMYQLNRRELTVKAYKTDSINIVRQRAQLQNSEDRMLMSLDAVGRILDNLVVRAPITGQLTTPDLEIGESIDRGQSLGQVDIVDSFKVRVPIDELYLPRIKEGQKGTFDFSGDTYELTIEKIFPTVTNGVFEVDMHFVGEQPENIKRGQTLRVRLQLSDLTTATLLPVGGFYQNTGGNWVYVLEEGDDKAVKRNIRLNRKNSQYYEVSEGLQPGDRVITSSYDNFGDNEVIVLD
ncbi:efflux RND transporter periplasmic adaptor subunit [Roseivirga sp. BDSF3-8]|uniref:efflux RND transporter periplasmic adaptor subunit n=1 Tax=Roseivirga sp. BDSF3-8 TaxID=3241598 RepID=UPI003531CB9D